ncbi:MAG: galactose-1-phosphate uridylyltransferase [Endomicrobia bacterium]|nr:galactose-1-phosphate uridylyltransferase [Endomicrobiia bacterium]MDW8055966.1 galactose-1-phosphate uridylyltransferase [Elusimicrobiota bacterium]
MPEIRQNIATKEWVVISTERAKRPEDFKTTKEKKVLPEISEKCPFCPGNEHMTPYETYVVNDEYGKWKIRVIPNKYPAVLQEGTVEFKVSGIKRSVTGVGSAEVIIESAKHNVVLPLMPEKDIEQIIKVYRERYLAAEKDKRIKMVIIFKNYGEQAGASIEHPHSQLIAIPVVPFHIRYRIEEAMRYYDETGKCVFCVMLEEELRLQERIVVETGHFVSFVPYAALAPFHMWLLPRRHTESFGEITDEEITDLAKNLKLTLSKLYYGLDNPDYNFVIRSVPVNEKGKEYYHWYITIMPRLIKTAGFEIGTGMSINCSLPEDNARFLREIKIR